MANWALVTYKCVCKDEEQAKELIGILDELKDMDKPYAENDFGNLWMGCLVVRLGGETFKGGIVGSHNGAREIRCRGEIFSDYEREGNIVTMITEQAWTEQESFRHFVESKFEGMKMYYLCDESNEGIYCSNDADGKFFHNEYWLDFNDKDPEYFDSIEDAAKFVGNLVGREVKPTTEDIEAAIDNYQEANDYSDESWMSLHGDLTIIDD